MANEKKNRFTSTFWCHFAHKWGKWSDPKPGAVQHPFFSLQWEDTYLQHHRCERCGKIEVREVR